MLRIGAMEAARSHMRTTVVLSVLLLAAAGCGRVKQGVKAVLRSTETAIASAAPARARTASAAPKIPLGMNLSSVVYYSTAIPFVDAMKAADDFISMNAVRVPGGKNPWDTKLAEEIPRDALGYPLELPYIVPGAEAPQILITPVAVPLYGGRYTLLYEGEGEITFPGSTAKITPLGPGRAAVDVESGTSNFFLYLMRSARERPIHNVRLMLPGFDGSDPKQVFHPDFVARLRGVSTLRFVCWMGYLGGSGAAHWQQRVTPAMAQGTSRGVAVEYMVDLANEVGADAWITVPHNADDDYVAQMAKLIARRLDPKLRVYVEYSNEIWNNIFEQHKWSIEQGCKAGLNTLGAYPGACEGGSAFWSGIKWNARRSGQVFRIFEKGFGGTQRLVRVLAGQAGFGHLNEKLLESFYDTKINAVGGQVDAFAIAPYFAQRLGKELASSSERATITPQELARRMAATIDDSVGTRTAENKQLADRFGARLIAYEAGQHLVAMGEQTRDEAFVAKLIEANRQPAMRQAYAHMIDSWLAASGGDVMMLFAYIERPSRAGAWGLLEDQRQPSDAAPKFQGYLDALAKLRAGLPVLPSPPSR